MAGQISITDWIPFMPPVEIVKPVKRKHKVPDKLKSSFKMFGSGNYYSEAIGP